MRLLCKTRQLQLLPTVVETSSKKYLWICYFNSTFAYKISLRFGPFNLLMQINLKAADPSYIFSAIAAIFSETWSHGKVCKKMERGSFLEYGSLMTETRLKFIETFSEFKYFWIEFEIMTFLASSLGDSTSHISRSTFGENKLDWNRLMLILKHFRNWIWNHHRSWLLPAPHPHLISCDVIQ